MGMHLQILRASAEELTNYLSDSNLLTERVLNEAANDTRRYDIDKSWDGIIYLLTGKNSSDTSEPLSRLIFSNQLIDENLNLGTGPAHYLSPEEVKNLQEQIRDIVPSSLKEKFNAQDMKEIGVYPNNVWDEEEVDDYLIEYFETVQEVFTTASKNKEAIITFIE
ncbi:DUF1877 family protein [Taibaiella lutea]|uniref:DUF1877 family protein n=1 Tax=Taibaiella lutea TaxID=2608001 RepID=A0A5M6CDQ6_9BACT|nr:YfbM family protein [Taibaiella lutea]KAA5533187.1 DUF1877 family protein [Taibaiella lutea]